MWELVPVDNPYTLLGSNGHRQMSPLALFPLSVFHLHHFLPL